MIRTLLTVTQSPRGTWGLVLGCAFFASSVNAQVGQTNTVWSITNGITPTVVAPGNPIDVYSLNGWESVNKYQGKVNIAVPLLTIGARGTPAYTVMATVDNTSWTAQVTGTVSATGPDGMSV